MISSSAFQGEREQQVRTELSRSGTAQAPSFCSLNAARADQLKCVLSDSYFVKVASIDTKRVAKAEGVETFVAGQFASL